jgi:hypothetical protein
MQNDKLNINPSDSVYDYLSFTFYSNKKTLPVTSFYSEMVAQIFPYLTYDKLPDIGKECLWF